MGAGYCPQMIHDDDDGDGDDTPILHGHGWSSFKTTGIQVRRGWVRDLVLGDRKTMEEARSERCPKEQI